MNWKRRFLLVWAILYVAFFTLVNLNYPVFGYLKNHIIPVFGSPRMVMNIAILGVVSIVFFYATGALIDSKKISSKIILGIVALMFLVGIVYLFYSNPCFPDFCIHMPEYGVPSIGTPD